MIGKLVKLKSGSTVKIVETVEDHFMICGDEMDDFDFVCEDESGKECFIREEAIDGTEMIKFYRGGEFGITTHHPYTRE